MIPSTSNQALKKKTILIWAALLLALAIGGFQLVLYLLLTMAKQGSHGALMVLDFLLFWSIPMTLLLWPSLQAWLVCWTWRFVAWGFESGTRTLVIANLWVFAIGLVLASLFINFWPEAISEAAANLNEDSTVNKFTHSAGTVASQTYRISGPSLAIALPQGLHCLHLSASPPGSLRYGLRPAAPNLMPLFSWSVELSAEDRARLKHNARE